MLNSGGTERLRKLDREPGGPEVGLHRTAKQGGVGGGVCGGWRRFWLWECFSIILLGGVWVGLKRFFRGLGGA